LESLAWLPVARELLKGKDGTFDPDKFAAFLEALSPASSSDERALRLSVIAGEIARGSLRAAHEESDCGDVELAEAMAEGVIVYAERIQTVAPRSFELLTARSLSFIARCSLVAFELKKGDSEMVLKEGLCLLRDPARDLPGIHQVSAVLLDDRIAGVMLGASPNPEEDLRTGGMAALALVLDLYVGVPVSMAPEYTDPERSKLLVSIGSAREGVEPLAWELTQKDFMRAVLPDMPAGIIAELKHKNGARILVEKREDLFRAGWWVVEIRLLDWPRRGGGDVSGQGHSEAGMDGPF
jgi:hypothetical protein